MNIIMHDSVIKIVFHEHTICANFYMLAGETQSRHWSSSAINYVLHKLINRKKIWKVRPVIQ